MSVEQESEHQRLTRNVNELLGEFRVAQAGVQILFGFLLAVVFTPMFRDLGLLEKSLHLSAVLLAVLSTALLSAPAAWHRVLFRAGRRYEILRKGALHGKTASWAPRGGSRPSSRPGSARRRRFRCDRGSR